MDILTSEKRSEMMSRIRGRHTRPEMLVRRAAHALGFRYRLHRKELPGSPDLVFPSRQTAMFVHGCFWHRHTGCRMAYEPKSNKEFWQKKFKRNVERDHQVVSALRQIGWTPVIIWECETRSANLAERIEKLLGRMP